VPKRRRNRDRRRRKRDDLPWLVGIGLAGYFLFEPKYGVAVIILFDFVVLMLWVLFMMPTKCHYDVGGRGCVRGVYGKLKGCHDHGMLKRDAIFAAMKMRNPGLAFRVMWTSGPSPGRTLGTRPPVTANNTDRESDEQHVKQGAYNLLMLALTAAGSIAGVLALFIK